MSAAQDVFDSSNIEKLGEYHSTIMAEICELLDSSSRMLAKAALPLGRGSRRYLESACLSIRRVCEYLAVACVFAHHWDGHDGPNLLAWSPKDLLSSVATLSDHPTPAPLNAMNGDNAFVPTALPLGVAQLVKLYGQCSSLIHVGRPDRIIQQTIPPFDLAKLNKSVSELSRLAKAHVIMLPTIQRVVIWDGTNRKALVAEAPGEGTFDGAGLTELRLSLYDDA